MLRIQVGVNYNINSTNEQSDKQQKPFRYGSFPKRVYTNSYCSDTTVHANSADQALTAPKGAADQSLHVCHFIKNSVKQKLK